MFFEIKKSRLGLIALLSFGIGACAQTETEVRDANLRNTSPQGGYGYGGIIDGKLLDKLKRVIAADDPVFRFDDSQLWLLCLPKQRNEQGLYPHIYYGVLDAGTHPYDGTAKGEFTFAKAKDPRESNRVTNRWRMSREAAPDESPQTTANGGPAPSTALTFNFVSKRENIDPRVYDQSTARLSVGLQAQPGSDGQSFRNAASLSIYDTTSNSWNTERDLTCTCSEDLDNSGVIDSADLRLFASCYNELATGACERANLVKRDASDERVNFQDLLQFAQNYGRACVNIE